MTKKKILVVTDGSCSPNPGDGGWAAILKYNGEVKTLVGAESDTTNIRMELTAIIKGLEAVKPQYRGWPVKVVTDSEFSADAVTKWMSRWKANGFKKRKNVDLLKILDAITSQFPNLEFEWVKAHNGHYMNERADELATAARVELGERK